MAHFLNTSIAGLVRFGSILLLLTLSIDSYSIEVENLYQVKIGVDNQSIRSREAAALSGFKEVLIRKSGSQAILTAYEVERAYKKVTRYLLRFEYSKNTVTPVGRDRITSLSQDNELDAPVSKYELQLDFEPRLIDELIQSAGMPIWGNNRPLTILWLALEQDFQRQIIKEEADKNSFSEMLNLNSVRRGIPTLLPLMDIDDQNQVGISDIWGRFDAPIIEASQRYSADSIVIGRINQIGQNWHAKLTYINTEFEQDFEIKEASVKLLFAKLTDRIAEYLCVKYCIVEAAESHHIVMQISNVGSYSNFKHVQKHLSDLPAIRKVTLDKISGRNLRFNVSLLGDLQAVKDALILRKKMLEDLTPDRTLFAEINQTTLNLAGEGITGVDNAQSVTRPDTFSDSLEIIDEPASEASIDKGIQDIALDLNLEKVTSKQADNPSSTSTLSNQMDVLYYRWLE